jgi:hypothetical protein
LGSSVQLHYSVPDERNTSRSFNNERQNEYIEQSPQDSGGNSDQSPLLPYLPRGESSHLLIYCYFITISVDDLEGTSSKTHVTQYEECLF